MKVVVEKTLNGKTETKVVYSEDTNYYIRDGWKVSSKPVEVKKVEPKVEPVTETVEPKETPNNDVYSFKRNKKKF